MTAEPFPDPQVPEPTTPVDHTTPEPTAPVESETSASAVTTAVAEGPVGAETPVDAGTPVGAETPVDADSPVGAETPVEAAVPAAASPTTTRSSRRSLAAAALRRLVAFVLTLALFIGGIAVGIQVFQLTHPPKAAVAGADVPGAAQAPPVAKEFIAALGANDADGLRSSLDIQPHADLTGEFKRFDIQKVTGVETLGTSLDGTRSATEILVRSVKTDGLPFDVNLVILVNNGKIEGFR